MNGQSQDPLAALVVAVVAAVVAAVASYLIWVWRNRSRPWITIAGCSRSTEADKSVPIDPALAELSSKIHYGPAFTAAGTELGDIRQHADALESFLDRSDQSDSRLSEGIARLKSHLAPFEVISLVESLLSDFGIRSVLSGELYRLTVKPPPYDATITPIIDWLYSPRVDGGSVLINFPNRAIHLASGCEDEPLKRKAHEALAEVIVRAEQRKLVDVFEEVKNHLELEVKHGRNALPQMRKIIDSNSHWTIRLFLTNYGSGPFLVLPEGARLVVKGPGVARTGLSCDLVRWDDRQESWHLTKDNGVVIRSGATEELAVTTEQAAADMPNGMVLGALFDQGNGSADVELRVVNAAWGRPRRQRSRAATFASRG